MALTFKKPKNELEGLLRESTAAGAAVMEDIFTQCPGCKKAVLKEELESNWQVCPRCGHHLKLSARARIALLMDEGSFQELNANIHSKNVLAFPEYEQKLAAAEEHSSEPEGVITGAGMVNGFPCCVFSMEGSFMMGSMGSVVGEKITRLFEYATAHRLPVIGYTVSGGARMQEGILSLMQMAKTSGAVKVHSDAGLLYITVLTNPTTGGVTASFAMEGDIIISEPGALICFAGPRVIEQTTRQKLPQGFQKAEFLLEKGFLDDIVSRLEQRDYLTNLLNFHQEVQA